MQHSVANQLEPPLKLLECMQGRPSAICLKHLLELKKKVLPIVV